jgi:hypothetical protein
MDQDKADNISQKECLRMTWVVLKGGRPKPVARDNLEWSTKIDRRRRALLKLL